jgi:hypothetical protein
MRIDSMAFSITNQEFSSVRGGGAADSRKYISFPDGKNNPFFRDGNCLAASALIARSCKNFHARTFILDGMGGLADDFQRPSPFLPH